MALYEITAPDGTVYEIEGPEGAAERDLVAAVSRQRRKDQAAEADRLRTERLAAAQPAPTEETTFGGQLAELGKGIIPGAIGLLETAGTGISALLATDDQDEYVARKELKKLAGIAKEPFAAAPGYEDSVGRRLGEGLGSTLPFFGAGKLLGTVLGTSAGAGEAREAAEAAGATGEERTTATVLGAPTGLLDILAPSVPALTRVLGKEIGPLTSLMTTTLARAGVEGATEAAQRIAQNLIAKGVYNPEQPILAGSGEEGAYGAGVGALASLIMDLTLGRRARLAKFQKPTAPEAEGTPETLRLGAEGAFTPVVMPDGSVAMSREDLAAYEQSKFDQQYAPQDATPSIARETEPGAQGELFQTDKDTALLKMAGIQGPEPQAPADFELETQEAPRGEQQELDLQAPVERDTQTMDMITDLEETQQIEEMVAQDEAAARDRQAKADAEKARLKFESDLAETDARVQKAREKGSEETRLELLLPIVDKPDVNIPKLFAKELKRNGLIPEGTEAVLTDREKKLIQRAYDLRLAEAEATPTDTEADNAALEAAIPEKGARREPVQMGLPGMAKPKGMQPQAFSEEEVAAQEEKPFDTVLTPEVLDKTGLPKQSGFYRQLLDMDMADPTQQPVVANIFGRVRENPNVKPATKDAIETLAMQAFGGLAKQGEMFGPRGGALVGKPETKGAKKTDEGTPRADTTADTRGTGTRASARPEETGKGQPAKPAPEATKPSERPRLGTAGEPASVAGVREAAKPTPVKAAAKVEAKKAEPAKAEPKKAEPAKAEVKAEPTRTKATRQGTGLPLGDNAYQMAKEQGEGDHAIRTLAADAYLNTAEDYSVKKAEALIRDLNDGKVPDLKFGKDNSNGPGTGGKYAKAFYASLDAKEKAAFIKELQNFLYSEIKTKNYFDAYNRSQAIARMDVEGDADLLVKDLRQAATTLHPEVVRAIEENNLIGALDLVADMASGRTASIAKSLARALRTANVDVMIVDFQAENKTGVLKQLFDAQPDAGKGSGAYIVAKSGKQKVILLDSNTGLDTWTLLHEATHAATTDTLNNPSHPLTKQLTQLFEDVKDSLGTAYGADSVEEFASEAFSNPEFQQTLAGINPKGEKITAWQRFVHAVKNFLRSMVGMPTKSMGSALDSADYLMEAIVQGHGSDSIGTGAVFTASLLNKGESAFKAIDQRIKSLPVFDNTTAAGILDFLATTAPEAIKKVVLRGLPLNALTEVASKEIPMAPELNRLEKLWNGAIDKNRNSIEDTWVNIKKWAKGNPEKLQALDNTVMESTLARVDPSKPRSDYAGKTDKDGNKLDVAWDRLQDDWEKLEGDGQAIYNQMRDSYAKMHQQLIDQILSRIDESVSGDAAKNLKKELLGRLATKGKIEPYFPLSREGEYRISYDAKGPDGNLERFVEHYATAVARDRAAMTLEAGKSPAEIKAMNIEKFKGYNLKTYRDAPSSSFMNQMIRTMEANEVSKETIEEVMRAYQNALPETAFAQAFRNRQDIRGANTNATEVFYDRSMSMSYQMANLEYSAKMYQLRDQINEHVTSVNRSDEARLLATELNSHIETLVRPRVGAISKALTSAAFGWTLGFNVSSAAVNMSQIPLVVMPYLGGKYGYGKTSAALGNATKLFFGSGLKRTAKMTAPLSGKETYQSTGAFSLDNYDFDAKGTPKEVKRLKELSELGVKYGLFDRSMTNDMLESGPKSSVLDKINKYSGFIFHHGERMNRQVSLVASYNLELERMAKEKKVDIDALTSADRTAAAEEAVRLTELLNGGASAGSAPLLAKNSIGKVIFMYKRYGASMYYMMYRTAKEAMKSEDKAVRHAAMRQILGIYASAGLMAGVQGLPMMGMLMMITNMFRDDDEDDAETSLRKFFGEGMYNGAANYLLGVNIASRIGLTDLLIADTGYKQQDNLALSVLQAAGGPVYGVGTRIGDGAKMIMDGEYQRGIEKILPTGFSNAMKSIRYATEGANTLRGDPIVGEMSYANAAGQFFGFAPADYTRQLEINANVKGIDRAVATKRTKLLREYYVAIRMGDTVEAENIMEKIQKFNSRHPTAGITMDTIMRSMSQHMRTSATMYHGITLSKSMMPALMANIAEYEGDDEDE